MQKGIIHYILSIAFLFFCVSEGLCCSCLLRGSTEREEVLLKIKESAVIFEAEVLSDSRSIEDLRHQRESTYSQPRVFSMRVRKAYKGEVSGLVSVATAAEGSMCGADFEVGRRYLVFTSLVDGKLDTGLCSGNVPIAFAGAELRTLKDEPPAAEDLLPPQVYRVFVSEPNNAVLCGAIEGVDKSRISHYQPIYVGLISWSSEYGGWEESDSDAKYLPVSRDGKYCYWAKPGKYLITVSSDSVNGLRLAGFYPGTLKFKKARFVALRRSEIRQNFNLRVLTQKMGTVNVKVNVSGKHDVVSLGVEDLAGHPLNDMDVQSIWHPTGTDIVLKDVTEGIHNFRAYVDDSSGQRIEGTPVKMRTNGLSQDLTLTVP